LTITSLETLDLSNNAVASMGTLRALAVNSRLRTLDLSYNPLCERRAMRPQLIAMFPALEFFNGARLPRLRSKLVAPSPSPTPARVRTPRSRRRSNGGGRRHSGSGDGGAGGGGCVEGETIGERATRLSREPAAFELCVLALSADRIERPKRVYRIGAETTLRRPQLGRDFGCGAVASEKESERGFGDDPRDDPMDAPYAGGVQERAPRGGEYYEPELYVVLRYGDEQAQCDAPVVAFRTSQGKRKKLIACECAAPTAGSNGVAGIVAGVAETKHGLRRKALVSFPHYINRKTPLEIALWEKAPRGGRDRLWATASVRASQVPLYTQHSQAVDAALLSLVAPSADAPKGGRVASHGMLAAKQSVHVRLSVRRRHDAAVDGGGDATASGVGDEVGEEERRLRQQMRAKRKRAAAKAAAQSPAWKQHLPRGNIDILHELTKTADDDDAELSAASAGPSSFLLFALFFCSLIYSFVSSILLFGRVRYRRRDGGGGGVAVRAAAPRREPYAPRSARGPPPSRRETRDGALAHRRRFRLQILAIGEEDEVDGEADPAASRGAVVPPSAHGELARRRVRRRRCARAGVRRSGDDVDPRPHAARRGRRRRVRCTTWEHAPSLTAQPRG
jgi:hypothetical protein